MCALGAVSHALPGENYRDVASAAAPLRHQGVWAHRPEPIPRQRVVALRVVPGVVRTGESRRSGLYKGKVRRGLGEC